MFSIRSSRCWGAALLLCTFTLLATLPLSAVAQDPRHWSEDPVGPRDYSPGIPVRQGHHIEWQRAAVSDADGNVLVTWSDTRTGDRDVYAQLILPDGTAAWDAEGKPIVQYENRQEDPEPRRVEGGWIIAWIDFRFDSTGDVYAQKIDMDGNLLWLDNDTTGVVVDTFNASAVNEVTVRAVHDGRGGAIIAWEDTRGGDVGDIYAQHLNSAGARVWGQPLAVTDSEGGQNQISADTDGDGNMVLCWKDSRNPNDENIYCSKIDEDGTLPWGGVNGVPVCVAPGRQKNAKVCSDLTSNGLYVAWVDERNADNHNLYMQRLNGNGNPQWQDNGLLLCGAEDKQGGVRVAASMNNDTQDGCLTTWEDLRVNGQINEIYAQKTSTDGTHLWDTDGVRVCGNAAAGGLGETRDKSRLTSDLAGGGLYVWDDTRHANSNILEYDIFLGHLDAQGNHVCGDCGHIIWGDANEQFTGVLRMQSPTQVLCVYNDRSRGSQTLRYQRLTIADCEPIDEGAGPEIVFGLDGDATEPESIGMTLSRVGVVWKDNRGGNNGTALFYQVLDADSGDHLPQFEAGANGDTLVPDNSGFPRYDQSDHELCSDGDNGFFVSFIDLRSGVKQVRLTRVDRNGEIACDRASEIVQATTIDQRDAYCVPDGEGGCYVAWSGFDMTFTLDVYVMRMGSDCRPIWAEPVRLTDDGQWDDICEGLTTNPDGCCIVVWQTGPFGQLDVGAARVCADGSVTWNQAVCTSPRVQLDAEVAADGNGGAYFVWADGRNQDFGNDIYGQHVDAAGDESWTPHNGILINSSAFDQKLPELGVDSDANLYVVWQDFRSGDHVDLYGQKVNSDGLLQWDEQGRALVSDSGDQTEQRVHIEWADGLYAAWTDARGYYQSVYGTHVDADGQMASPWWIEGHGGPICDEFQNQSNPSLADDGHGGVVAFWVDWRASGKEPLQNLWTNWVNDWTVGVTEIPSVTVPMEYALSQNYPNPFNPSTQFEFTIPRAERVEIALYNTLGQNVRTLVDKVMTAGTYRVTLDAGALASGIYFYRLTTPSFQTVRKMTLIR